MRDDTSAALVLCGAFVIVLAIHVGFTFGRHLDTGWRHGIYPRYCFPLLPALSVPALCSRSRLPWRSAGAQLVMGIAGLAIPYDALRGLTVMARGMPQRLPERPPWRARSTAIGLLKGFHDARDTAR